MRETANLTEKTTLIKTFPGFNGKVKLMIAAGLVFKHELDLKKKKLVVTITILINLGFIKCTHVVKQISKAIVLHLDNLLSNF